MDEFIYSDSWDGKRRKLFLATCKACQKEHYVPKHVLSKHRACSKACEYTLRDQRTTVTCGTCGSLFLRQRRKTAEFHKRGVVFCSRECKDKAQRFHGLEALRLPHYKSGGHDYRMRALADNGARCNRCEYKEDPAMLDVHHKDSNRENGHPDNLEVICVWCHALETRRRTPHAWAGTITDFTVPEPRNWAILPAKPRATKAAYPDDAVLATLVWAKTIDVIAQDLGVSYNAVKSRCKLRGIVTPVQGYWLVRKTLTMPMSVQDIKKEVTFYLKSFPVTGRTRALLYQHLYKVDSGLPFYNEHIRQAFSELVSEGVVIESEVVKGDTEDPVTKQLHIISAAYHLP